MTRNDFISLGAAAFNMVAAKRQALVEANKTSEALLDACPCSGRCKCGAWHKANNIVNEAQRERHDAEGMWREYSELRAAC